MTGSIPPHADGAELHRIAAQSPALRDEVAAHPAAYPELLAWLGTLGDPAVDRALAARHGTATPIAAVAPPAGPPATPPAPPGATTSAAAPRGFLARLSRGSKVFLTVSASIGTLLAGVAAVLAFWLPPARPAETAPLGPAVQTTPTAESTAPEVVTVVDIEDAADEIVAFATPLLSVGAEPYASTVETEALPFRTRMPAEWDDIQLASWEIDDGSFIGDAILVALDDVETLYDDTPEPGAWFSGTEDSLSWRDLAVEPTTREATCETRRDVEFGGGKFLGLVTAWGGCGEGFVLVDVYANSAISGATTTLVVKLVDVRDLAALRTIFAELEYLGP